MKKLSLTFFVNILLSLNQLNAQAPTTLPSTPKLETLIPQAPNTASFMKYNLSSVDLHTGANPVNIPLYTINVDGFQVPITLSNSGTALKVDELPSSCGMGWTLNVGGVITFTEEHGTGLNSFLTNEFDAVPFMTHDGYDLSNNKIFSPVDNNQYVVGRKASFSFMGYSGSFYLTNSNNNSGRILTGDKTFKYKQDGNVITIINSEGVQFVFGNDPDNSNLYYTEMLNRFLGPFVLDIDLNDYMRNNNTSHVPNLIFTSAGDFASSSELGRNTASIYLRKIILPNSNKEINFEYKYNKQGPLKYTVAEEYSYIPNNLFEQGHVTEYLHRTFQINNLNTLTISKIKWPNGKIDFDLLPIFIGGNFALTYPNTKFNLEYQNPVYKVDMINNNFGYIDAINKVKIFNTENELIKGFDFNYVFNNTNIAIEKKFFLNSLQEFSTTENIPPYKFDYDLNYTEHPNILNNNTDYWGYFNYNFDGYDNKRKHKIPWLDFRTDLPAISVNPYTKTSLATLYLNKLNLNNTDNLSPFTLLGFNLDEQFEFKEYYDPNYQGHYYNKNSRESITYGMLLAVEYPTGGKDEFYYTMDTLVYKYNNIARRVYGGGVKISKIVRTFKDQLNTQLVKNYTYTPFGVLNFIPQFTRSYFAKISNVDQYYVLHTKYGNSLNSPSGAVKSYSFVTETIPGKGKTIYYYHDILNPNLTTSALDMIATITFLQPSTSNILFKNPAKYTQYNEELDKYPYYSLDDSWVKSKLWKVVDYDLNNNIVKSLVYDYQFEIINNDKIKSITLINDIVKAGDPTAHSVASDGVFKLSNRNLIDGHAKLNKLTTTIYNIPSNNSISTVEEYTYNLKNKIRSISKIDQNNVIEKQYYYYVYDFNGIDKNSIGQYPTVSEAMEGANSLLEKNILSKPICFEKYIEKPNQNPIMLSSSFLLYKNFGLQTLLWKEYILNSSGTLSVLPFNVSNSTFDFVFDSKFKLYRTYNLYNENAKPIELLDNNLGLISYKWCYKSELPVAQIINGKNSTTNIGNNTSYIGFESGSTANNIEDNDYWSFNQSNTYLAPESYTGKHGMVLMPNNDEDGIFREFHPDNSTQTIIISGWIKIFNSNSLANGITKNVALNIDLNGVSLKTVYLSTNNSPSEWKYFSVPIELATPNTSLRINFNHNAESGNRSVVFDDIRVQPLNSTMTTYTYETINNQVTSISDENNKPTHFEYDEFGRLTFQKDFNKNILKSTIYLYQPKN